MFADLLAFEAGKVPFREPGEAVPLLACCSGRGQLVALAESACTDLESIPGELCCLCASLCSSSNSESFPFPFSPLSRLVLLCQLPLPGLGKSWLAAGNENLPERALIVEHK